MTAQRTKNLSGPAWSESDGEAVVESRTGLGITSINEVFREAEEHTLQIDHEGITRHRGGVNLHPSTFHVQFDDASKVVQNSLS